MRTGAYPLQSYVLCMLMDAYRDEHPWIRIAYRTDGHLLNRRWMHFQSLVSTTTVHELLFADDCALNTTSEEDMQRNMDLFYAACENFGLVISSRRQDQIRRYKDTLKSSLKRLQINPTNGEELALDRQTWRRTVKADAAIYEANRIAAANVKREARKSQLRSSSLPPINSDNSSEPPLPSSSSSSSSTTVPTTAAQAGVLHITNHDTTTETTPISSNSSDEDQDYTCPHCDRTFTSHIGLVGHLRIHRTETGEPVPGASTYTHQAHCPHCPRTFTHRMGLFGHMRIHDDLRSTTAGYTTHSYTPYLLQHHHPPNINIHPPQAPNCNLLRTWEVYISTGSPCGFGCTDDLSPRLSRHVKRRG
nr:unnamed protein product [Spirometra erinaceieuropaei]